MKSLIFLLLFLSSTFIVYAQSNRNAENFLIVEQGLNDSDSLFVQGFADAFENYAINNDGQTLPYYFTPEEADRFTTMLLESNYPEIDENLSVDILKRSEIVKQRLDIIASTCNMVRIVDMEKRLGYTDILDGILVQLSFGKDDEWTEELSVLFTAFESQLKVLSIKEEK